MLSFITWTADPTAFTIPFLEREVRWYGIVFALGFVIGAYIVSKIWKNERLNDQWYDKLFFYMIVAVTVGARLGHCLFYDPGYYLSHPIEIFKVWEGGLASHGGTIGIIVAVWIYSKKITHKSMLWTLDRIAVPVGFVGALIRIGNLMNHEIYGYATNMPWSFRFITNMHYWKMGSMPIFSLPSHPTQIYEAICYIITASICMWMYWKRKDYQYQGLIFGACLTGIFISRFVVEFFKNVQENFEIGLIHSTGLNMGQWLSIPFILAGCWFIYKGLKAKKEKMGNLE